jgi:hypothetical protein
MQPGCRMKTGMETGVTHNTGNRNGKGWLGWRETTYLRERIQIGRLLYFKL